MVQRPRGSPGVHRMRAGKLGVTGSARVAGGQGNAGPSASRPGLPTGMEGRGSARPLRAGGTTGPWMEGARTRSRTPPSSSLGLQVALISEFSYGRCTHKDVPPPSSQQCGSVG